MAGVGDFVPARSSNPSANSNLCSPTAADSYFESSHHPNANDANELVLHAKKDGHKNKNINYANSKKKK
jgi:hypothetical protein